MGLFFCVKMTMSIFDIFHKWRKQELSEHVKPKKKARRKRGKKNKEPANPEKARIIRKLKYHMKSLDLEHEEVKETFITAKTNFFHALETYCRENPSATNPLVPAEKKKGKDKVSFEDFPEDLKTIYREIIKATHPDKHPDDEELGEICISATQAKQNNKIEDLINISFDLDIDVSNMSVELIEEIESALKKKEAKIEEMRKDTSMMWYHATKDQQDALIKQLCPIKEEEKEEE